MTKGRFYSAWRWSLALAGMALLVAFLVFSIGLLPRSSLSPAGGPTSTVNLLAVSPTPDTSTVVPGETGQSEKQTPLSDQEQHYVVQERDTWTGIASTFGLTPEELRSLNGIREGVILYVGQDLVVSRGGEAIQSNATPPSPYVVQEGDTWTSIAYTFGLTPEELRTLNGMSEGATLFVGQKLIVNRAGQTDRSAVTPSPPANSSGEEVPEALVPGACDIPVSRLYDPQMLPFQSLQGLAGGGTVESGAFTMELWLVCDPSFSRAKISGDQFSEIDGLGLLSLWHYHGQDMDGYINEFAGVEPYVKEVGGSGPVRNNPSGTVLKGLQFPAGIIPDFSQADTTLRYVFKTRTPDGVLSGAALYFTLQRQADGYRPVGIYLQVLPESELQTVDEKPDVPAPFATQDPYMLYPQLQEVHDLLTRWQAPLRATPGWMHRLTRVHDESSNDLYAGKAIDRSEELLDGGPIWVFNFGEAYQEPVLIENEVLASAISRREVLDPESGAMLLSKNILVRPDGQEQVRSSWTYVSVERVDQPPGQVLEVFGQDFGGYQPAAPIGTPPPPGFDPSQSALRLLSIPGDDFNLPTFWYGDIYAGDYLFGGWILAARPVDTAIVRQMAPGSLAVPVLEPAGSGPVSYQLHGITFSLEKVAQVKDGYISSGSLVWQADDYPQRINSGEILLTDGNGQAVPVQRVDSLDPPKTESDQHLDWILRTDRTAFVGPLKFSMDSVGTAVQNTSQFELELGPDPQVGQSWGINRSLQADGHIVKVISAKLESHPAGLYLNFKFDGDPDVTCVSVGDASGEALWDSTGSCRGAVEGMTSAIHYASIPNGTRRLALGFQYMLRGPWQVNWTPPAAPTQPSPAPTPEPCLTYEKWRQVEAQANPLPEGLDGRLLAVDQGKIYLTNLDGSDRQIIGEGFQPSISSDGARVVFVSDHGLYLVDAVSGQENAISWSQPGDGMPKWSPDGTLIAFLRQGDVYLFAPDGSGLHRLTNGLQIQSLTGWTLDGKQLVVEIPSPPDGSVALKLIDASSGEISDLFRASPRVWTFTALSPDGRRGAFVDRIFGQDARSLFLAPLDGEQVDVTRRRPLIALDYVGIVPADLVWSPDGKWLLVNMYEARQYAGIQTPLLLQPDTCQAIRLGAVQSSVLGWVMP